MTHKWLANDLYMTCEWLYHFLITVMDGITCKFCHPDWWLTHDLWMTCEWLVNDLWMTYKKFVGRYPKKCRMTYKWLINDCWMTVEWLANDLEWHFSKIFQKFDTQNEWLANDLLSNDLQIRASCECLHSNKS